MMKLDTETERRIFSILLTTILTIGLSGNLLNLIVLSRKSMRKIPTFRFLLNLSFVDILVLLVCTTDALFTFGFNLEIRLLSNFVCRLHSFLTYFLAHLSSTILMTLSIEKAAIVCNRTFLDCKFSRPQRQERQRGNDTVETNDANQNQTNQKRRRLPSINRVEQIVLAYALVLALVNMHYLIFIDISTEEQVKGMDSKKKVVEAQTLNETSAFEKDELVIDLLIATNNLYNYQESDDADEMKIFKLKALLNDEERVDTKKVCFPIANSKYLYFLSNIWLWIDITLYCWLPFLVMVICSIIIFKEIGKSNRKYTLNKRARQRFKKKHHTLVMLTATNIFFIASTLPYCILYYMINYTGELSIFASSFVHTLAYSNNSFNFIFYGLFSKKYRREIAEIFKKTESVEEDGSLTATNTNSYSASSLRSTLRRKMRQDERAVNVVNLKEIHHRMSKPVLKDVLVEVNTAKAPMMLTPRINKLQSELDTGNDV